MFQLAADNISLVFPLYGRPSHAESVIDKAKSGANPRLIHGPNGDLIGVKALTNVNFALNGGHRLGIVGANGSGKTTLLQVLAGIYTPDSGRLHIKGRRSNLINIGLGMRAEASGRRNIVLGGLAAGHSRADIIDRQQDIEAFSELGEFLSMPVSTYSSGMRMRLSFAIATAFDPEILILDEWLSAGDENFKRKAAKRMKYFVETAGILVLASHNASLLRKNCDLGLWLHEGEVADFGEIDNVLEAYVEHSLRK
ncbi:MAG: ABC transporter ATP-binding protein [Hyphomonadaceae bacterium]